MRRKTKSALILTISIISVLFNSCKPKPNALENYDRSTLLKNAADNVITPSYNELNSSAINLETAAIAFANSPDVTNLDALKTSWNIAVTKWERCEVFSFGYAYDNSLNSQIGFTPANFPVIEDEIHGANTLDANYIAATGTSRKGFASVEYLLYGNGTSQQAVLDSFTSSAFASKRKQYLTLLCQHIRTNTTAVYSDWNNGNSYNNFVSQTQLDVSGSLNILVNALTAHIELVRKSKIGKPAGIDNGGVVDGSTCEYILAPRSNENILENIQSWKDIYTGKAGVGLDDYLDHVGAQYSGTSLSTSISEQLDVCITKASEITMPLHQAVTQQPTQVAELYLELKKLTVLTKTDMASNLGVVITFSDNDGD